ncbi:MAG: carbohydrate-binding family 9-like protein [Opitutaceae bacterium]|jgi:hypothetical protein|nr:carbohydrate-binding family 9-like protein [Opitutaceae bacterium]
MNRRKTKTLRTRLPFRVLLACACAVFAFPAHATDGEEIFIKIPFVSGIKIQPGERPSGLEWKTRAARLTLRDFWRQEKKSGQPLEPTEVLLLATQEALFVTFLAEDSHVRADPARQPDGDTWRDDCVEVFLAPPEENPVEAIGFEINPDGVITDLRPRNVNDLNIDWNAPDGVRVSTARVASLREWSTVATNAGWIMQMEIPWRVIRISFRDAQKPDGATNRPPGKLRANFARWNHPAEGWGIFSIWTDSGLKIPKPHAPARFGWLVFEHRSPEN